MACRGEGLILILLLMRRVARPLADGHVKRSAAAMLHRGLGEAHDMQAKAGFGEPLRHEPAQNAPFICLPEIAARGIVGLAALAGDDKHVPKAVRLAASQETAQNDIGVLLP